MREPCAIGVPRAQCHVGCGQRCRLAAQRPPSPAHRACGTDACCGECAPPAPRNRAGCNVCGDIVESTRRHDYVACKCDTIAVDGGLDYFKRVFKNSPADWTELPDAATLAAWEETPLVVAD